MIQLAIVVCEEEIVMCLLAPFKVCFDGVSRSQACAVEAAHRAPMMMMFIGTETLVTQLVHEISRMQAC